MREQECSGAGSRHRAAQQDSPTAPHVDGRGVTLLPEQQFWGSVPQRDHFVGVGTAAKHQKHQSKFIPRVTKAWKKWF